MEELLNTDLYRWMILPLSIFVARLITETIGTLRIMFLSKGNRVLPPIMGFFEVLLWVVIIGQIMQNLDNVLCYIAYAGGFAVGSVIGMTIESKLSLGAVLVHVITRKNTVNLQKSLKENDYGFTSIKGKDIDGVENMIFIIVKRKELKNVVRLIKEFNPKAFFSVGDVRNVSEGVHPLKGKKRYQNYGPHFLKKYFPTGTRTLFSRNTEQESSSA